MSFCFVSSPFLSGANKSTYLLAARQPEKDLPTWKRLTSNWHVYISACSNIGMIIYWLPMLIFEHADNRIATARSMFEWLMFECPCWCWCLNADADVWTSAVKHWQPIFERALPTNWYDYKLPFLSFKETAYSEDMKI